MKTKNILFTILALLLLVGTTLAQPVPSYVPVNGLQGWWPFNGDGNDISGNGNNATNYGAAFTPDRFGNPSSAASVDGVSQYLKVDVPTFIFDENSAFTYAVWIKKQPQVSSGVILMVGTTVAGNFISNVQGNNEFQFGTNKQQSAWIWTTCPHTLGVWDHYVATYGLGIMKLYKNGVYQSQATYTYGGAMAVNQPLWIGRGVSGNNYVGELDDAGIWNRALTQAEITALYESCDFSITSQPANQTVNLIGVAKFTVAASSLAASYQWQTKTTAAFQNVANGGQYLGATNDTLTVSNAALSNNNQQFRCIVNVGTCKDTSAVATMTVNNSVGILEPATISQFNIFPNPFLDKLNLIVSANLVGTSYRITNLLGATVQAEKIITTDSKIDLSPLPGGIYLLRITGTSLPGQRIIKQ